jgi:hypothetical protein
MSWKARATAVAALLPMPAAAFAGPFADFEKALLSAYAPYRAALIQTNQKDKAGTEKSLQAFAAQWRALMTTYRAAPPPQYADDPKWPETVAAIEATIAEATAQTVRGDLAKAHDTLEAVRDKLGELRARNNVVVFSDRMDAYHEKMEQTLAGRYDGFGTAGLDSVRENAAVLAHLAEQLERHAPPAYRSDAAFKEGLAALVASVKALQSAMREGDKAGLEKALKGLKPPYAKMFVRFG